MGHRKAFFYGGLLLTAGALVLSLALHGGWYWAVFVGCAAVIAVFFSIFETKNAVVEKTVLLAVLSATASAGRALFMMIPSVQPASFIILLTGMIFGAEAGFITGALTAFISSMLMGFGPWTLWQMFAWGVMGLSAAALSKILQRNKWLRCAFSLCWGFLFGWIMNVWTLFTMGAGNDQAVNAAYVVTIYAASIPFDAAHGIGNALLMAAAGDRIISIFTRMAKKYGLL